MFRSIFSFTALILIILMGNINAATYYVDNVIGNDGNTGLSTSTPWKTLAKVNGFAFASGSIVSFKCGDRFNDATLLPKSNCTYNSYGTGARPVIDGMRTRGCVDLITGSQAGKTNIIFNGLKFVNGLEGNITLWSCNYITFDHCNIDSAWQSAYVSAAPGMFYVGGDQGNESHHITIRNSTISYSKYGHGFYWDGAHNVLMEYDTVQYNGAVGIQIYSAYGTEVADSFTVRYCVIRQNGAYGGGEQGILDNSTKNSNFYYNIIENHSTASYSDCIALQNNYNTPPRNTGFYNNTFIVHNGCFGIGIGNGGGASGIDSIYFKNNIYYLDNASAYAMYFFSAVGIHWQVANNLYYISSGSTRLFHYGSDYAGTPAGLSSWKTVQGYDVTGSLLANPLFTNYASGNYTLQSSSPSVNAGINVSLTVDLAGNPVVGNPDLGAYEFKSAPTPVELTTFSGIFINNSVRLTWSTATEINNQGFDIERYTNSSWVKIGFIEGKGNSVTKNDYSFEDKTPVGSSIQYRLKQIDYNGNFKYYDVISVTAIPQDFSIGNYPNPFNPSTKIRYSIPSESMINLVIYSLIGERIDELKNEIQQPGTYETNWNGSGHASGIYFLSIIESPVNGSAKISKIIKMNLIK